MDPRLREDDKSIYKYPFFIQKYICCTIKHMKFVREVIEKVMKKDQKSKKHDEKTAKYAREVTEKYKKTLRKLAHE